MAYEYKFINKFNQFGNISYSLDLKDTCKIMPEYYIPIIIQESEDCQEKLNEIAEKFIIECTNLSKVSVDVPFLEEILVIEETIQQ
jgi:hypothetical protein